MANKPTTSDVAVAEFKHAQAPNVHWVVHVSK